MKTEEQLRRIGAELDRIARQEAGLLAIQYFPPEPKRLTPAARLQALRGHSFRERARAFMSRPHSLDAHCPHGFLDWDDCPKCGH